MEVFFLSSPFHTLDDVDNSTEPYVVGNVRDEGMACHNARLLFSVKSESALMCLLTQSVDVNSSVNTVNTAQLDLSRIVTSPIHGASDVCSRSASNYQHLKLWCKLFVQVHY